MISRSTTWARAGVVAAALAVVGAGVVRSDGAAPAAPEAPPVATAAAVVPTTVPVFSPADAIGQPWGTAVEGVLTFRGNPTRTYHGEGPVPSSPSIRWTYPAERMCSDSTEYGETRTWCGTGWTGQPAVFERDGRTWVVFGAYDAKIHFVDAATGEDILPPLQTGDLAKGAVTVDPDGYPIVYAGSRDNELRVIAIDGTEPTVLWSLDARDAGEGRWNDDWDAAPMVIDGHLVTGGENSRLHVVRLNRGYGADGRVTADPTLLWSAPGWDDELLRELGDHRVSFESSVTVLGDIAYLANSGGLVQGWDLSPLRSGVGAPTRVFRFWTGDDTDATIVADADGFLYVGVEVDRATERGTQLGQLLKLDPRRADDPVVWAVDVGDGADTGTWSTPALHGSLVIWPTKPGTIHALDRTTGEEVWQVRIPGPVIGSPTVVDDTMLIGDSGGVLHAFELGAPGAVPVPPTERWTITLGGTIESTATVWRGSIYLGTRDGHLFAIGGPP